jgi:hypothetical protein
MTASIANQQNNGFLIGAKVIKNNNKELLKGIKITFEWAKTFIKELDFIPQIDCTITLIKGAEDALTITDFGQAFCKTAGLIKNAPTNITNIARSILDFNWSFFKVCKALKVNKILPFGKKFITNLSLIGGASFALSSLDKLVTETKALFNIDLKTSDELVLCRFYRIAKNIGTLAIGTIISSGVIFGTTVSATTMLFIGTVVLISGLSSSILNEIYNLQLK